MTKDLQQMGGSVGHERGVSTMKDQAFNNSATAIQERVRAGGITWAGPVLALVARSILAVLCQALVSAVFFSGRPDAWDQAGTWWRVYGTLIDAGTILLLTWLARREGIRLFDLGSYDRERWLRDVGIGAALFVPIFALTMMLPGTLAGMLFYGGQAPDATGRLPVLGLLYAFVIWPVIWAFAEDSLYFGYSLPRLEALTGKKWLAVALVSLFATLQHGFLPFRLDGPYFAYRLVSSVPVIVVLCLLYLRQRRLLPIHAIHWAGNVLGIVALLVMPAAGPV
jgi:membrane protease YdiL (CAAX protease family)